MFASNTNRDLFAYRNMLNNNTIVLDSQGNILPDDTTANWQQCNLFEVPPVVINTVTNLL